MAVSVGHPSRLYGRVSPLQLTMAFADGWLKSHCEADTARKAPYGDAWAERIAKTTKEGIETLAADPQQTVQALMRALTLLNPPSRMITGWYGTLIFKPLSWLPDAMRDAILYKMSFPGAPPCGLAQPPPVNNVWT